MSPQAAKETKDKKYTETRRKSGSSVGDTPLTGEVSCACDPMVAWSSGASWLFRF